MKRAGYIVYAILVVVAVTLVNLGSQSSSNQRWSSGGSSGGGWSSGGGGHK